MGSRGKVHITGSRGTYHWVSGYISLGLGVHITGSRGKVHITGSRGTYHWVSGYISLGLGVHITGSRGTYHGVSGYISRGLGVHITGSRGKVHINWSWVRLQPIFGTLNITHHSWLAEFSLSNIQKGGRYIF